MPDEYRTIGITRITVDAVDQEKDTTKESLSEKLFDEFKGQIEDKLADEAQHQIQSLFDGEVRVELRGVHKGSIEIVFTVLLAIQIAKSIKDARSIIETLDYVGRTLHDVMNMIIAESSFGGRLHATGHASAPLPSAGRGRAGGLTGSLPPAVTGGAFILLIAVLAAPFVAGLVGGGGDERLEELKRLIEAQAAQMEDQIRVVDGVVVLLDEKVDRVVDALESKIGSDQMIAETLSRMDMRIDAMTDLYADLQRMPAGDEVAADPEQDPNEAP